MIKRTYGKRSIPSGSPARENTSASEEADDAHKRRREAIQGASQSDQRDGGSESAAAAATEAAVVTTSSASLRTAGRVRAMLEEFGYYLVSVFPLRALSNSLSVSHLTINHFSHNSFSEQDGARSLDAGVYSSSFLALARMLQSADTRGVLRSQGLCHQICRTIEAALDVRRSAASRGISIDVAFGLLVLVYLAFEDGTRPNAEFLSSRPLIELTMLVIAESCGDFLQAESSVENLCAATARARPTAVAPNRGNNSSSTKSLVEELQQFLHPAPTARATHGSPELHPAHTFTGSITPSDLALYIQLRVCKLTDEGGLSSESESGAVAVPEAAFPSTESSDSDMMLQSTAARNSLRLAANGRGLLILALIASDAASTFCKMATSPPPPSASAALMATIQDKATLLALKHGVAPRFTHPLARLRIVLAVLEDALFLSQENTAELAAAIVPSRVSSANVSADGSCARNSFVSLLLSIAECSSLWLRGAVSRVSQLDAPTTGASDDPVIDILHAALRVLMNLTNNVPQGCAALLAAKSISQSHVRADRDWGLSVVVQVAVDFQSPRVNLKTRSSKSIRVHREEVQSTGMVPSVSASQFDALVLSVGLLANCIEIDPLAQAGLRRIVVAASDVEALPTSVGRRECGGISALDFFCWLFASRFASMNEASAAASDVLGDTTFNVDDVVLGAYIALLIGVCARSEVSGESRVLESLGNMVRSCDQSAAGTSETPTMIAARMLTFALRAFVAVQTSAGVLTEEALGHISSVQETLDLALRGDIDGSVKKHTAQVAARAGWSAGGVSLEAWLEE